MLRTWLFLTLCICFATALAAQGLAGERNLDRGVLVQLGYGPFSSAGDLGDRFGGGFSLDAGAYWTPDNQAFEFGLRAQYGFGDQVKEDVLAGLRTDQGFIIGNQRDPADVQLRQRQLFVGPSAGLTLALGENRRAGVHLKTSVGYLWHRIRIQGDVVQGVAPLADELVGGYDRLAGGPAVHQFVGYQQLARDRLLNFYVGVDATVGFTNNRRGFDIPTGAAPPAGGRTDVILAARAGIILPLYLGEGREIFYK